jgi:very-short-patch-repair endonuclease
MQKKSPLPTNILSHCRNLRKECTDVEKLLWYLLRNRQFAGAKFRRQHPVGNYIIDFYCHEKHLAIELDGGQHADEDNIQYDKERTQFLEDQGIQVLRFWNNDVFTNTESVLEIIWNAITLDEE